MDVGPRAPFFRPEGVPAWLGVEYLGQAAAVWFALMARQRNVEGVDALPPPGMLVACRRYRTALGYFAPGVLTVSVQAASMAGGPLVRFAGEIGGGERGGLIARGDVSVYLKQGVDAPGEAP